ncbi:MAG: SDR family NAD(P)-dependent oxidoreductase [Chitinophagaceae bacterium]|nr:SDR family NAD(P)-dependent oxidoreductase [Chitinophagaceae bacterium]
MSSSNKKLIIVGASSGIGKELAKRYVENGWLVGITGRRNELLNEFQKKHPEQIFTECFDVRGNDNITHVQSLINKLEGLDLLIYNSGYGDPSETLEWELDKTTYETNVKGFIEIVHFAFNYFVRQGHGHIAATSSLASIRGSSWAPAYSASKAFMSVYMEGLHMKAKKIARKSNTPVDIFITDIQPGFVNTKLAKGNGQFWVAPVEKVGRQIINAIDKKKWRVYVTRRWWLIAQLMKWAPGWLYHRVG